MKKYVGIDVGLKGGIAILDQERNLTLYRIPLIKDKLDLPELTRRFQGFGENSFVCIEDVHSIFGASAKSNFNFGRVAGIKQGLIVNNGYPYEMVQPKIWQKMIWTNQDMVKKASKKPGGRPTTDTKATSLLAAKRLFPDETFIATARSKNPHDGLIDAALIAEYCRRIYG